MARTLGRAPTADFILNVALVSRVHCRIVATDDALDVEDLSSTNGTFLNNQRIDHGKATSGDRLRIGRVELMVERGNT
jgi:pSer/pThr/pTyr-binding forkhead associated (FHA) protein